MFQMPQNWTHGTGMSRQNQQLGKLQTPVDLGVSAGQYFHEMAPRLSHSPFPMDTLTNITNQENPEHPEHPEIPSIPIEEPRTPVEEPRTLVEEPRTPVEEPRTPEKPRTKMSQVKLGHLGIHEKPEEFRPPVVYGKINGHPARIMLDSGCSTYVLSTDFARDSKTPCYSCKPIPVELAVRDAGQFNLDTQTKKLPMEIGKITQSKAMKDSIAELYLATIKTIEEGPDLSKFPKWVKEEFSDV